MVVVQMGLLNNKKRNRETNLFKFLELYDFLGVQGNWFIWHFGYLLMGFKDAALKYVLKGKHGFVL